MFYPESNPNELNEQPSGLDEQSDGTQGAGDQAGEQSAEGFDPSKLTPELQKVYKGMEAGYTKKTQAISEKSKSLEQKETQLENLRSQYEQKLVDVTQPKGEEKPLVDISQMTTEQRNAWDMLNKHFDKKLELVREEERRSVQSEIGQLKGYIGQMEWKQFARDNPGAGKYRDTMKQLQVEKGGTNCPLNLDDLLTLAQKDDLKKLGVEEYKQSVQTKRNAVTSSPQSRSGENAGIELHRGPKLTLAQKTENIRKAFMQSKEDSEKGRG